VITVCAVIPVYNHGDTVAAVVEGVRSHGLACLLVDDGSDAACAAELERIAGSGAARLLRLEHNGGKGHAVKAGLQAAFAAGYSHALQVDADGQHELDDIPAFTADAAANPHAVICGRPVYGPEAPRARLYGRWLTHVWVWINTLSFAIPDAMCGFRIYPLHSVVPLVASQRTGECMDFDIAILVRLHWAGVPMVWRATGVVYHPGGVSHFHGMRDNALISLMHARLFAGMLARGPALLARKLRTRSGR
jgi:glycosyltransferase involved in cell wall biosynthesis